MHTKRKGINDTSGACEKRTFRYLLQLYLLNCLNPYRKVSVSHQFFVVVQTYPGLLTQKKNVSRGYVFITSREIGNLLQNTLQLAEEEAMFSSLSNNGSDLKPL